jgi:predicted ATPase/DNA-binding SARP family transcriptional activator/Tfp pilus assembly protein PilF
MIRLRTLGGLELRREDGTEVRSVLAQPRRTALLVCLTLASGRLSVRRDLLMGRLWPDSPQDRARHSLNQGLYQLRRSLGQDVIVSHGDDALSVDPARLWCDVRAFDSALGENRLEDALELYRGDLLPGFFLSGCPEFENWLEEERGRIRESAARAAWDLAERAEREGLTASATSWGRRALALCGEDETALQRLLRLLARSGDRAGAVAVYEAFTRRLSVDPGVEPSAETRELIREIRGPRPAPTAEAPVRSPAPALPRRTSPLVGRDAELGRLAALLELPLSRIVTVTGPGGVGKTALVLEFAREQEDRFPDGVWFVPLAAVATDEMIPLAILHALGLPDPGPDPIEVVGRILRGRKGLLILDNLEHIAGAAEVLAGVLNAAPEIRILTTTREVLRLRSEWVLPLEGLDVPEEDDFHPETSPSVRLFLDLASQAGARLRMDGSDTGNVARICRLVEGIPLAIELAAAWTRSVPLDEICREIETSRRFLAGQQVDVPERHRSLWAAFEHSWALLSPAHRRLLARLSVFRGGFDRDAAAHVAEATLQDLAALIEKSLVRPMDGGRHELLEAMREFAAERLARDPEDRDGTVGRHAEHYTSLLHHLCPELAGPAADDALDRCAVEMDNLRAAWRASIEGCRTEALGRAADALFVLYDRRGWNREADGAFRDAVDTLTRDGQQASGSPGSKWALSTLLARRGAILLRLGRSDEGEDLLRTALILARELGDAGAAAFALDRLGVAAWERGDHREAEHLLREALELRQKTGDMRAVATSLNNLGSLAFASGDHRRARELCEECLVLQRRLEDRPGEVISLQNLGHISLLLGDEQSAELRLQESLRAARGLRHGVLTVRSLLSLAQLASIRSSPADARRYLQSALARATEVGSDSLAVDAILGIAITFSQEGEHPVALELATMALAHPALEAGARSAAERLARKLEEAVAPGEREEAIRRGEALSLRMAANRLAGAFGARESDGTGP